MNLFYDSIIYPKKKINNQKWIFDYIWDTFKNIMY